MKENDALNDDNDYELKKNPHQIPTDLSGTGQISCKLISKTKQKKKERQILTEISFLMHLLTAAETNSPTRSPAAFITVFSASMSRNRSLLRNLLSLCPNPFTRRTPA